MRLSNLWGPSLERHADRACTREHLDEPAAPQGGAVGAGLRRRRLGVPAGPRVRRRVLPLAGTVRQIAIIALLVGLPIVLVLAWYHGDRGQQRISTPEFAILTLLLLLGGGAFWYYQRASEAGKDAPPAASAVQPATSPAVTDPRPSVPVLPFENRSRLEDDAFFVDGIHDDILTQLSKVSALRVISRTSVEQFRDTRLPMKAIAEQLGVTKILEGGVQRAGDQVRVHMQLIDAATDAHVWAESYDRELTAANIFAIQSEIAVAIAGALKAALTAGEKARVDAVPTENLAAWEAYQLGKQLMRRRTSDSLADAGQFFRKAIHLDSTFALAYVGLADTLALQVRYSGKASEPALAEADRMVTKALERDSNLAEAWASAGGIAMMRGQSDAAGRNLRRAIDLNQNYAPAHHWLSMTLRQGNEPQKELEYAERAVQLDPLSGVINSNLADTLERMGRLDEAAARHRKAIELDPKSATLYLGPAGLNAYGRNRFVEALPLVERAVVLDAGNPEVPSLLALLRLDLDDVPEAIRLISTTKQRWPGDPVTNHYAVQLCGALDERVTAEGHAREFLAADPQDTLSLAILRNADLRKGDYKSARARYASAFPALLDSAEQPVNAWNLPAAVDLVLVLQRTGDLDNATALLNGSEQAIRRIGRLGYLGYGISDVQIHALRGETKKALALLREAEEAGWRGPFWRYYRDVDPNLASIRNEPEFKRTFDDIERDMARQRAALAARPKDAPLELAETGT
jgi:TolB-like protein